MLLLATEISYYEGWNFDSGNYLFIDIDIFVDCDWVNTRWQWYIKHDQYIGHHK